MAPDLLRKYVAFSRKNVKPRLTDDASSRIQDYYIELRKIGMKQGATPITPRQIEGLVRLAEASSKTRLSDLVELKDAEIAIGMFNYMLNTLAVDRSGRKDIDIFMTGMPKEKVDRINSIMAIIKKLEQESGDKGAEFKKVFEEAEKAGMDRATASRYINELERTGDIYSPVQGILKRVRHEAE